MLTGHHYLTILLSAPKDIILTTLVQMASGSKRWKKKMVGFFIASTEVMKNLLPKQEEKMEAKRHGWIGSTHLVMMKIKEDALGRDRTSVSGLNVRSTADHYMICQRTVLLRESWNSI